MNYRSFSDLQARVAEWAIALPDEVDLVVGVPRSGLLPATLLALHRHLPMADLDGFLAGRIYDGGRRFRGRVRGRLRDVLSRRAAHRPGRGRLHPLGSLPRGGARAHRGGGIASHRPLWRGLRGARYRRGLLRIGKYGVFAWMLWSHKVARWALPFAGLAALAAIARLAPATAWAQAVLVGAAALAAVTALAWLRDGALPRPLALLTWAALGNIATVHAAIRALGAEQSAIWEPTRRQPGATLRPARERSA
jgi:hypothetical protein